MLREIDNYFNNHEEPIKNCLLFMQQHILQYDPHITEAWKYGMPFYCYNHKMCCYLWVHKKYKKPYLGIVEGAKVNHPLLIQEDRARMKIFLLDAEQDIPIAIIDGLLQQVVSLYK